MPPPLSPRARSARARLGAYAQHAKYDTRETTAKARQVFRESFAAAIREEHPELDEDEVQRRGDAARKAWYSQISFRSAKARARRARRLAAAAKRQGKNIPLLGAPGPLPDSPASGGNGDGSGSELLDGDS
jgi:hypothetical protein